MSQLERDLQISIEYVRMRKSVEALTEKLAQVIHENDLLRQENRVLELKLQRIAQPKGIFMSKPQAG
jgi:regulator of replication initiation timing